MDEFVKKLKNRPLNGTSIEYKGIFNGGMWRACEETCRSLSSSQQVESLKGGWVGYFYNGKQGLKAFRELFNLHYIPVKHYKRVAASYVKSIESIFYHKKQGLLRVKGIQAPVPRREQRHEQSLQC